MSSGFGLAASAGGMALLMTDPPDGLARAAVSCATWLFSELSWLWSEVSCSLAAARWDELTGRLAASMVSLAEADSSEVIRACRAEIWLFPDAVLVALV